jgi:hypothetical protein
VPRDDLRQGFADLMHELRAQEAIADVNDAMGWTVSTLDTETGRETLFGFYTDPIEAMAWANDHSASVNRDLQGDPPFVVTVRPIIRA